MMKLKRVKFLAKLGILALLIGGTGTALLLHGCQMTMDIPSKTRVVWHAPANNASDATLGIATAPRRAFKPCPQLL